MKDGLQHNYDVNNMFIISSNLLTYYKHVFEVICHNFDNKYSGVRSEGNWRPGAKLNIAPPLLLKKILKNDIEMSKVFN